MNKKAKKIYGSKLAFNQGYLFIGICYLISATNKTKILQSTNQYNKKKDTTKDK